MSPTLVVETEDLAAAARSISVNVAQPMTASSDRLVCGLLDAAAMAGDDAAGTQWASCYDRAATSALAATQDVVNGAIRLAALFAQTARNYEAADSASTAGTRRALSAAVADLPGPGEAVLATSVPSAAGGSGDSPTGWGLVKHLVGYVWPDGHQDRLRAAAATWRTAADALTLPANKAETAAMSAVADRLPEGDDMQTVCMAMYRRIDTLASAYLTLARACDDYAHHIDEVHHEIISELTSLLEWTAAIEGAGALFAVVTFGGSEAAAQAAESARIGVSAGRIGAMIEKFVVGARALAQSIPAVEQTLLEIRAGLKGLLGTRLAVAGMTSARALPGTARTAKTIKTAHMTAEERLAAGAATSRLMPHLATTRGQIEKKFSKHADDFGVATPKGRDGFQRFERVLKDFVSNSGTTRVHGFNRGSPAILNYDPSRRLLVIQHPDGSFWTCYRMSQTQLEGVLKNGRIGIE